MASDQANGPAVRRWLDKILLAAVGLVVVLVGTLWGLTWAQANGQIAALDLGQRQNVQRVLVLEGEIKHIREALSEIKGDVRYIKDKLK